MAIKRYSILFYFPCFVTHQVDQVDEGAQRVGALLLECACLGDGSACETSLQLAAELVHVLDGLRSLAVRVCVRTWVGPVCKQKYIEKRLNCKS